MSKAAEVMGNDVITFDTELELFEQIKSMAAVVEEDIPEDSDLFKYRVHFDQAYQFFKTVYKQNQKLLQRAQEQNTLIVSSAARTNTIVKLVQSDASEINKYKQEYEEVTATLKKLQESESRSREILRHLSQTVTRLSEQVSRGEAFSFGDENTVGAVGQDVSNLQRERDKGDKTIAEMSAEIAQHKDAINHNREAITKLTESAASFDQKISECQAKLDSLSNDNESTRHDISIVRPIVTANKKKADSNKEQSREISARITEKKGLSYDTSKKLIEVNGAMKAMRYTLTQKEKHLDKVMRKNERLNQTCDDVDAGIARGDSDGAKLREEKKQMETEMLGNIEQLEKLNDELDGLDAARREGRAMYKQRKDQTFAMRHQEAIKLNERSRTIRKIHAVTHEHATLKTRLHNEKLATEDLRALGRDLTRHKKATKRVMQREKIALRGLEQDIEMKRKDIAQIRAKENLALDEKSIYDQKQVEDTKWLDELRSKDVRQVALTEELRNERNTSKRKWETLQKEDNKQRKLYQDLREEKKELEQRLRRAEEEVAEKHFKYIDILQRNMALEESIEYLEQLVVNANHSISGLAAQEQLLKRVLHEAASDKMLQAKEFDSAMCSRNAIGSILGQRKSLIEKLRGEIVVLKMHIEKRRTQYNEKCAEIAKLNQEATVLVNKNMELERIKWRWGFKEHEGRRLAAMYAQEMEKNVALIHEINCPRNVHRWQMYSATDPAYTRNIEYLSKIYAKIDQAHRDFVEVQKEKAAIEAELKEKQTGLMTHMASGESTFVANMNKYKEVLAEKDREMSRMKKQIDENREKILDMQTKIGKLKGRVTERKSACSQLRGRNIASRNQMRPTTVLFMTEPQTPRVIGGGFVQRIRDSEQTDDDSELLVSTSQMSTPNRGQTATPGQRTGGKIKRPQTAVAKRRPTTPLVYHAIP